MSIGKYLQHYAEGEIKFVATLTYQWQQVICIPAFDEADTLPALLNTLSTEHDLLVILVLNSPASNKYPAALERTQKLGELIKQRFPSQQTITENCQLLQLNKSRSHILLLEKYFIPDKEGVGLARKIACDIACQLIHDNKVLSPWIYNTDADVTLPTDYFSAHQQLDNDSDNKSAAALLAFKHEANPQDKFQHSLQLYEYSLYYYVEALKWADSPYAFHTIGSTLLLHYNYYALARGFPKRAAGEDFYLLNKLKKIGNIQSLTTPVITLSGRSSTRVPFGTGPAINKISELNVPDDDYLFYHPDCFLHLKNWLTLMPHLWQTKALKSLAEDELLFNSLINIGAESAITHALKNSKSQASFTKHMHNWFDAFRTLKLVHSLRDMQLKSINLKRLQNYKTAFPFILKAEYKVSE
ncbi:MAG: hypothetical protein COA71_10040 [SAR86 cluster bacterium]|uniref:Glycosyltransferase 2-like domain-containing protein n=1 Tax=SAR86 cluster bacterium TaxID=2030880 RepID=A0A2A5CBW7_9GAMM|nr:MAG: hypothetical protein COA71_10040 [SAR86 cluster bacterium]